MLSVLNTTLKTAYKCYSILFYSFLFYYAMEKKNRRNTNHYQNGHIIEPLPGISHARVLARMRKSCMLQFIS